MVRRCALLALLIALGMSCTGGGGTPSPPSGPSARPSPSPADGSARPDDIQLDLVAGMRGPQAQGDRPYVDGMLLALREVNAAGGVRGRRLALIVHDDGGSSAEATRLMRGLLANPAPALLYVGEGAAVSSLRTGFQRRRKTAFLLEGDLYTGRGLFRQVFQTTIPWEWQASVVARYLVRDRRARTIGFIGSGGEAQEAERATQRALTYWGSQLAWGVTYASGEDPPRSVANRASGADAVVVFGSPTDSSRLVPLLEPSGGAPRIAGGASLLATNPGLPPGTVACSPYTWAGWADPIRRVHRFRQAFRSVYGREPVALEQEGYDAIRLLAEALDRTGGIGGGKLTTALEGVAGRTYSGFRVDLGPDDHVLAPRDELGLFAVAGPDERVDPWQQPGSEPWRAIMRTFTYDGTRASVLDMDRRVFFPFWRRNQPGPEFYRSRYGIRTRSGKDHLH